MALGNITTAVAAVIVALALVTSVGTAEPRGVGEAGHVDCAYQR